MSNHIGRHRDPEGREATNREYHGRHRAAKKPEHCRKCGGYHLTNRASSVHRSKGRADDPPASA